MIEIITYIYSDNIKICKLIYREYSKTEFEYIFQPIYHNISIIPNFKGIQGINLNLNKKEYIRKNLIPSFVFEHTPLSGKKDFHNANRIEGKTLLEYLAESTLSYFGDNLIIRKK